MIELKYGLNCMFKLMLFSYYTSIIFSVFWVGFGRNLAKRDRYNLKDPQGKNHTFVNGNQYYMSAHGISSSVLYFWLYKNKMALAILPLLAADLYIWGPYYSNGALMGLAFGLVV